MIAGTATSAKSSSGAHRRRGDSYPQHRHEEFLSFLPESLGTITLAKVGASRLPQAYPQFMVNLAHPDGESLRLELQEAITTFRHQTSSLTQVTGFIAAADSVLIAYGFSQKVSGILLVASVLPVIAIVSYVEILHSTLPLIYVAITLEQKLQLRDAPLATLYLQTYARDVFGHLDKDIDMTDQGVRESILSFPRHMWLTNRPVYILCAIFIAQVGLFLVSLLIYHYRFM